MTISHNADANVTLGGVTDYEGQRRAVLRDFDQFVIPEMTLTAAGVTELEARIADYRNAVARYRLRELDFDALGIDLDECRDWVLSLSSIADGSDPRNLELVDWVGLGRRLEGLRPYGYDELRKLHALLTADETPACNCVISGGPVIPACCKVHGIPCEYCGGLESCADDCGEVAR